MEPESDRYLPTNDVQKQFADLSKKSARNIDLEQAFLRSKIHMIKKQALAGAGLQPAPQVLSLYTYGKVVCDRSVEFCNAEPLLSAFSTNK